MEVIVIQEGRREILLLSDQVSETSDHLLDAEDTDDISCVERKMCPYTYMINTIY